MNTPNKLTLLRVILVPFFVAFLLIKEIPYGGLFAMIIFIVASITDAVDGNLARKHNLVTDFGKFLDPLADKVLVLSAMICFIEMGYTSAVPVIIIIAREFMVTSIRLVAASDSGKVIAASMWGKVKTAVSMVSIVLILFTDVLIGFNLFSQNSVVVLVTNIIMWICAVITVISGVDYLVKNKHLIDTTK